MHAPSLTAIGRLEGHYLKLQVLCASQTRVDAAVMRLQMQVALWKSCLNPVQSASLMVRSSPRYPDVLAIMNAVAEADGAPSAAELMADGDIPALPACPLTHCSLQRVARAV